MSMISDLLQVEVQLVRLAWRPESVTIGGVSSPVDYRTDEEDRPYAFITMEIGHRRILAEIDGETYGNLKGFRIYLDSEDI